MPEADTAAAAGNSLASPVPAPGTGLNDTVSQSLDGAPGAEATHGDLCCTPSPPRPVPAPSRGARDTVVSPPGAHAQQGPRKAPYRGMWHPLTDDDEELEEED